MYTLRRLEEKKLGELNPGTGFYHDSIRFKVLEKWKDGDASIIEVVEDDMMKCYKKGDVYNLGNNARVYV